MRSDGASRLSSPERPVPIPGRGSIPIAPNGSRSPRNSEKPTHLINRSRSNRSRRRGRSWAGTSDFGDKGRFRARILRPENRREFVAIHPEKKEREQRNEEGYGQAAPIKKDMKQDY